MTTFEQATFAIEAALAGQPLGGLDVGLAEDDRTVVMEFRAAGGDWDARSFDLPAPVDPATFDRSRYADEALRLLAGDMTVH